MRVIYWQYCEIASSQNDLHLAVLATSKWAFLQMVWTWSDKIAYFKVDKAHKCSPKWGLAILCNLCIWEMKCSSLLTISPYGQHIVQNDSLRERLRKGTVVVLLSMMVGTREGLWKEFCRKSILQTPICKKPFYIVEDSCQCWKPDWEYPAENDTWKHP